MKNILVVNINWLGDAVFSTPVFKALKNQWPEAKVSCLAVERIVPIMEACPYTDDIILLDEEGRHKGLLGKWKLITTLRRHKFDAVFLLHRSRTRAFVCYCAGIPVRVGFRAKKMGPLLTHKVEPVNEQTIHRADKYLKVLESFGIPVDDRSTELRVDTRAASQIKKLLTSKGVLETDFLMVAHLGANWDLKRWPEESFRTLFDKLRTLDNARIVISGGLKDREFAQEVITEDADHIVSLVGQTHLTQLIALMSIADAVVSSDSGPLHIASSVGTATIGIFGPTHPDLTGPRGKGESVILRKDMPCNRGACYVMHCPIDKACVLAVTPDEVFEAVKNIYQTFRKANRL